MLTYFCSKFSILFCETLIWRDVLCSSHTHQISLSSLCSRPSAIVIYSSTFSSGIESWGLRTISSKVSVLASSQRHGTIVITSAHAPPVHEEGCSFDLDPTSRSMIKYILNIHTCLFKTDAVWLLDFVASYGRHYSQRLHSELVGGGLVVPRNDDVLFSLWSASSGAVRSMSTSFSWSHGQEISLSRTLSLQHVLRSPRWR